MSLKKVGLRGKLIRKEFTEAAVCAKIYVNHILL